MAVNADEGETDALIFTPGEVLTGGDPRDTVFFFNVKSAFFSFFASDLFLELLSFSLALFTSTVRMQGTELKCNFLLIIKIMSHPGWAAQLVGASRQTQKGCGFNPRSRHIWGAFLSQWMFLSLSPPTLLSKLKIIIIFLEIVAHFPFS